MILNKSPQRTQAADADDSDGVESHSSLENSTDDEKEEEDEHKPPQRNQAADAGDSDGIESHSSLKNGTDVEHNQCKTDVLNNYGDNMIGYLRTMI